MSSNELDFDSIIFDLDGTLWNTSPTCALAWNNVVKRNQIPFREIFAEDVEAVTGLPHEECIRSIFAGATEEHIQILVKETMTEDNLLIGRKGGLLYRGVRDGLRALSKEYPLFIASNCQSGYIEAFLSWSQMEHYFKDFECWGNTQRPKSYNVESLITRNGLKKPVMVGDTESDATAARDNSLPFLFVDYGFGRVSHPTLQFSTFDDLSACLLS